MATCGQSHHVPAAHRQNMKLFVQMYINRLKQDTSIENVNIPELVDSVVQYLEAHGCIHVVDTPEFMQTVQSAVRHACDAQRQVSRSIHHDMQIIMAQQQNISDQIDESTSLSAPEKAIAYSLNYRMHTEKLQKLAEVYGMKCIEKQELA